MPEYRQLFKKHNIDKLSLFLDHKDDFFGLLPLSNVLFQRLFTLFLRVRINLEDDTASTWRCNVRDPLLSILSLAETVYDEFVGVSTFLSKDRKPTNYLSQIIDYIHANCIRKISIPELCELVGINRNDLSREFKSYTGKTIVEYITDYRLEHTKNSLLLTERTLNDIAQDYGIKTESYLVRSFSKKYGITPTAFRKTCVKNRKLDLNENYN